MWTTKASYWLETNGAFAEGIRLLNEKGIDTRRLEPRSQRHLITQEMKKQVRQAVEKLLASTPHLPNVPERKPLAERRPEPPEVQKLRDRGKRLMKQRSRMHAMLSTASSDQERYDIAREMCINIQPKIDQVYSAIRDWERSGNVPAEQLQDDIVDATVKKMLRRDSIRVRLRQLRAKLKNTSLDAQSRKQYEQEQFEKAEELAAIDAALGL